MNCKGCDKPVRTGEYHPACYKSKMSPTTYIDEKMDLKTYPINHEMPGKEETKEEQWGHLYSTLGVTKATHWMTDNVYNDVDMEDIFHKVMEGEIVL